MRRIEILSAATRTFLPSPFLTLGPPLKVTLSGRSDRSIPNDRPRKNIELLTLETRTLSWPIGIMDFQRRHFLVIRRSMIPRWWTAIMPSYAIEIPYALAGKDLHFWIASAVSMKGFLMGRLAIFLSIPLCRWASLPFLFLMNPHRQLPEDSFLVVWIHDGATLIR